MNRDEAMAHMRNCTPLDRVRGVFSGAVARMEQEGMQRRPIAAIEARTLEFDLTEKIIAKAVEVGLVLRVHP